MPQLPEDIIDRLTAMERRIQQLSTAVNSRPALNKVSGGGVEITDGGYLAVRPPGGGPAVFAVGAWQGTEYGLAIRRQTGTLAMSLHNGDGTSTSQQPLRIYDSQAREIFSDDIVTGGLARPWLVMLPPQDTGTARWPQTTATSWTTIAVSHNPVWQPKMRLMLNTRVSSGAAGQVRVLVNGAQWGSTITAGSDWDHTALLSDDFAAIQGSTVRFELQAMVTSASGTVYANPVLMYGRQT
ncbi:hypothetical protein I2W78_15535 [Streptomyces spinoverrucosus]|uniref:hypothetical protein n=1 Tax=Streptomyces spinoverrucosus TaxID=284043 RepID=UPI0018C3E466|nr:hypothetical protein [Streptomyces spinoverrucosus]MBG0853222.1 hypothetical protein [Streptomyces spinoverrucosus]